MSERAEPQAEPELGITVSAAARRLGVAPATLRTWDRRYGLGATGRGEGCHRRYSESDFARLELMRHYMARGVPVAKAAELALAEPNPLALPAPVVADQAPADLTDEVRGLTSLVLNLDQRGCRLAIRRQLEQVGAVAVWDQLIRPVMLSTAKRSDSSLEGIAFEHLLSDAANFEFNRHIEQVSSAQPTRIAVFAGAPGEQHTLALVAAAAAAAEAGIDCRLLGAQVPFPALAAAMTRIGPAAVLIWSQSETTADAARLLTLPKLRQPCQVLVAGPGWPEHLPETVQRVNSISGALELLVRACL